MCQKNYFIPLVLFCLFTLFCFLGEAYFNTRGEPREAIVALSMLDKGNWVLPINNGVDMAYKPPFFHWVIAVISFMAGGVSEYTSRMPSALALMAMVLVGFCFYAKRRGPEVAFLAALITLTNFEVHRAGTNCRVDMVLSALMVIALYQLYKWGERRLRGIPLIAILCLSGAALTKGPVGLVLPCVVPAVFLWIRGMEFKRIFLSFLMVALLACVLPALWYWGAYQQGGEQFLNLVLEENVWRFLGKMTYTSHENPAYYNVITLLAGYAPYTLLVVISLFFLPYGKFTFQFKKWWTGAVNYIRNMDDARLYSLLSVVIIFVFYCIPKSKRSVYLLPIYPFIAYFLAEYMIYLYRNRSCAIKIFGSIMCGLSFILLGVFVSLRCGLIPETIFSGRHAAANVAFMQALETAPLSFATVLIILLPLVAAIWYFYVQRKNASGHRTLYAMIGVIASIFFALDGFYQPTVLNVKSDKPIAEKIRKFVPEGRLYSYRSDVVEGNRMHPFTVNFYLGDRVAPFDCFLPREGYVLMGEDEEKSFMSKFGKDYILQKVYYTAHRSCDDHKVNVLYYFKCTSGSVPSVKQ